MEAVGKLTPSAGEADSLLSSSVAMPPMASRPQVEH